MNWLYSGLVLILTSASVAQEVQDSFLPQPVGNTEFAALQEQSPFTRTLNLSDSLILTGVARLDEEQVATLMNKETKETFVVSGSLNSQGWKMVELKPDSDLEKVAAKVSVDGGEVVTVRYSDAALKPGEAKPGAGRGDVSGGDNGERRRFGGKGDGPSRGGPPPEVREKMEKLTEEQRGKLFEKMREWREKNPDKPREAGFQVFRDNLDKMVDKRK